jgi:hypothetical protein
MTDPDFARLADEMAVRAVLDEYCLRLEANAFADWLDLFTDDTVYEVYKLRLEGKSAMAEVLSKAPHGVHLPGATRIAIAGDCAESLQSYLFIATGTDEWNAGWYRRDLVRTPKGWKIARTTVRFARKEALPPNERAKALTFPIGFA